MINKKPNGDLGIEMQKMMSDSHNHYETISKDLFLYVEETLNSILLQFKTEGRMDKVQDLQALLYNFIERLLIEKNAMNMMVLQKECKLDPSLAPKLEQTFGKKIAQYPPSPKQPVKPNDQNDGGYQQRFSKN